MSKLRTRSPGLTADLVAVIGPLHRALRRRVREDWPLEPLPSAQIELLRTVSVRPGLTVGEAAPELRIASTLVNQLVAAGLIERAKDASDRRSIRLATTPAAEARMSAWHDRRQEVLGAALERIDEADRAAIAAAMPALRRLEATLER